MTSYRSPKTEIRSSLKRGKGLFAKNNIHKDEIVGIKSGHIIYSAQLPKIRRLVGDYDMQIEENFSLSPINKSEIPLTALYLNHSCDPNIGVDGQIIFVALRNIKAGEELCYDYAMTTTQHYMLKCNCRSKYCRKIITGDDWKRKDMLTISHNLSSGRYIRMNSAVLRF